MNPGRCPTCRASFRGTTLCSRCGSDLTALLVLEEQAWLLRDEARRALARGEAGTAWSLADGAQKLHRHPAGAALVSLAGWLEQPDRVAVAGTKLRCSAPRAPPTRCDPGWPHADTDRIRQLADRYQVSTMVVERQIQNAGRSLILD